MVTDTNKRVIDRIYLVHYGGSEIEGYNLCFNTNRNFFMPIIDENI